MKVSITIVLTFCLLNVFSQNSQPKSLGVGFVITADPYKYENHIIPKDIFKDHNLTQKWCSEKVFPFYFKPEYGLFHFICLERKLQYYKILINDHEVAYLPNNENYYFKTWDAILFNTTVERLSKFNPIRNKKNDHAEVIINSCENERLKVEDVQYQNGSYWLLISFSPECIDYPDKNNMVNYGWIKWREDGKLLVNILLLC